MNNTTPPSGMVLVPAGTFRMGSTLAQIDIRRLLPLRPYVTLSGEDALRNELPQHEVELEDYFIDVHPVTNRQYKAFCDATGHPPPWTWKKGGPPIGMEDCAVTRVSWYDAVLYAEWAGKRLPTEAEWEKAARGSDGRIWPWGDEPSLSKGNYMGIPPEADRSDAECEGYLKPVGSYPDGASPYGCLDMAGNVWEWCSDRYDAAYYARSPRQNPLGSDSGDDRTFRGGSWTDTLISARCATRQWATPSMKGGNLGFRCAASSTPDLIRQQRQQNVEEARKYGASLAGRAILQNKVAIVTCQLSIAVAALLLTFAWLKSWWLSGFAAYYGLVLADGLLFILDTRDRLAARIAFEVVHFAPALLICVVLQVIWHLPPLSALGGLLAGVLLGRILNAMLFPSIYDEYRLSRKGR